MILANQGLVYSIALEIYHRLPSWFEADDLVSYGNIGLIMAVDRYDEKKGIPFAGYASFWIRGQIYHGISEMNEVPAHYFHKYETSSAGQKQQPFLMRPDEIYDARETRNAILDAYHRMSATDRTIFRMAANGKSWRKIAKRVGKSRYLVQCRYRVLRDRVQRCVEPDGKS